MSTEPQFLAFKGLKQYSPNEGWGQVNAILKSHAQTPQPTPAPENVPTLTETPETSASQNASHIFDPLINELFEQLRVPPSDDLTHTWRTIAAEVNLLTERMALQR